jgi:hypothetical protein
MMLRHCCVGCVVAIAAVSLTSDRAFSQTPGTSSLQLEAKIPLGDVKGRIDHMAICPGDVSSWLSLVTTPSASSI